MTQFDTMLDRRGSDCKKWDSMLPLFGREDLMPFWIADTDFPILPEIIDALSGRTTYAQSMGYTSPSEGYYANIQRWFGERQHLQLEKGQILPVPGVVCGLWVAINCLTEVGDGVVINSPVYPPFFHVVENLNRKLMDVPLMREGTSYSFDFDKLEEAFQQGAKMFVLCSPHNPVGRVWTKAELERVVTLCRQYQVLLVSDEIHSDIIFGDNIHTPMLNLDEDAVIITAPSKTFNIAGLKSSMIFAKNAETLKKLRDGLNGMHLYTGLYGLLATSAAYQHGGQWADEQNVYLQETAKAVVDYLQQNLPQVKAYVPESTYLMWLDFSDLGLSEAELKDTLINKAKIALNAGSEYGSDYSQFARFNIGAPRAYVMEGVRRMVEAFQSI